MHFRLLPFYKALIIVVAIASAYMLALAYGHAPACFPNLEGCVSLSALGRASPENFVFRALLIPVGVLMVLYWSFNRQWLILLGDSGRGGAKAMLVIGIIAGVSYIFYLAMLGSPGQITKLIRGIWVTLFFSFMFLSQLFLINRLWKLRQNVRTLLGWPFRTMVGICVLQLIVGFAIVPVSAWLPHADYVKNAIEWNFVLLMVLFLIANGMTWNRTGFHAELTLDTR